MVFVKKKVVGWFLSCLYFGQCSVQHKTGCTIVELLDELSPNPRKKKKILV